MAGENIAAPNTRQTHGQAVFKGNIAIDGPSAAGKSTVGREIARRLGYAFLDTGSMYRTVTWAALHHGVDLGDEEELSELAANLNISLGKPRANPSEPFTIFIDGKDVTDQLRQPEVEAAVSLVSRIAGVRSALVAVQREIARAQPVVMAGRDIGTVVLPDAALKIYLEASIKERSGRRHREMESLGRDLPLAQVEHDLSRRDRIDSERAVSPLRPAADAITIDTDNLTLEEVIERVMDLVHAELS